jgi:hypothetical protein
VPRHEEQPRRERVEHPRQRLRIALLAETEEVAGLVGDLHAPHSLEAPLPSRIRGFQADRSLEQPSEDSAPPAHDWSGSTPKGVQSVRFGDLAEAEAESMAEAAASPWDALRSSIDGADAFDHRPADAELVK